MILSLCVTHKRASVPLLESLTFKNKEEALKNLYDLDFVKECVILQTCNRVEVYVVTEDQPASETVEKVTGFWSQKAEISRDIVLRALEVFQGREALDHLLSLASGLESMVVGEDQILGQVRAAYTESKKVGVVGAFLETLFMKAVHVGGRVRTETRINEGAMSISSVAVDLAEKHLGDLGAAKILLVGAGEAGTLAGKELHKRGIKSVLVANRTYSRGAELAKMISGEAIRLEEIYDFLPLVDAVIVAASARTPILTLDKTEKALADWRKPSKLLIIDISQPMCTDKALGSMPYVDLRNIDDLRTIVEGNLQRRMQEVEKAREIVLDELEHLEMLLRRMTSEPFVSDLCRKAEEIRKRELSKALRMLTRVDKKQRKVIGDLTRVLVERILQAPIENMRFAALSNDNALLSAAEKLFNLKAEN